MQTEDAQGPYLPAPSLVVGVAETALPENVVPMPAEQRAKIKQVATDIAKIPNGPERWAKEASQLARILPVEVVLASLAYVEHLEARAAALTTQLAEAEARAVKAEGQVLGHQAYIKAALRELKPHDHTPIFEAVRLLKQCRRPDLAKAVESEMFGHGSARQYLGLAQAANEQAATRLREEEATTADQARQLLELHEEARGMRVMLAEVGLPKPEAYNDDAENAREVIGRLIHLEELRKLPFKSAHKDLTRMAAGLPFGWLATVFGEAERARRDAVSSPAPQPVGEEGPKIELRQDRVGFDSPEHAARIAKVHADVESLKSKNPNRRD